MVELRSRTAVIPEDAKTSSLSLLRFIAQSIGGALWQAGATRLLLVILAAGAALRIWMGTGNLGPFDGFRVVALAASLVLSFNIAIVLEEFFHAVSPLAKARPDLLHGILIADLYSRSGKRSLMYLFAAIKNRGARSLHDEIHISASGPLGVIAVALVGYIIVLALHAFTAIETAHLFIVITPLLVCGISSLIPATMGLNSDGANIESARCKLQYSRLNTVREALRGLGQVLRYLARG